jgi:hypothetical protein
MTRQVYILIACLILFSVVAVFVSPGVNLEPTAMRAVQAATLAMAALAAAATLLTSMLLASKQFTASDGALHSRIIAPPDLIAVICTRLC